MLSQNKNKYDDLPIGTIPIDSIYTPVKRVNFTCWKYKSWSNYWLW